MYEIKYPDSKGIQFFYGSPEEFIKKYEKYKNDKELLISSAIFYSDTNVLIAGDVPCKHEHILIVIKYEFRINKKDLENKKEIEGFLTNHGRFLNKSEAFKICEKAKQYSNKLKYKKQLLAENIWPNVLNIPDLLISE